MTPTAEILHGDVLSMIEWVDSSSVDSVVCDPPYAEIGRPYGRLTEPAWHDLMHGVVREVRRVLKPKGSAVFVIQPNSDTVGKMRTWVWDFMCWCAREWNVVQDAYWWNYSAPPTVHCSRKYGLMRNSMKVCVWVGDPDCYRNQDAVLWDPSDAAKAMKMENRALRKSASGSGHAMNEGRMAQALAERGGVTPFNVLPIPGTNARHGHSAATPMEWCSWWVRYLTPPGGTVMDPFTGSGTVGVAAIDNGMSFIGIERDDNYFDTAQSRINEAVSKWIFLS